MKQSLQIENRVSDIIQSTEKQEVGRVVCGFLNTKGGKIIIESKQTKFDIVAANELNLFLDKNLVPKSFVSVSIEKLDSKDAIVIDIPAGSKQPYVFERKIYVRRNDETVVASADEISELILARQASELHWERQIASGVTLEDLDSDRIKETIANLNKNKRGQEEPNDVEGFLMHYNLYQDGGFTNAAVVLFAKHPTRFVSQSRIRISVFPTGKTGYSYEYDQFLEGNLFDNIDKIVAFFDARIGISSLFKPDSWFRIDRPQYPVQALREGVLNALIHRDYEHRSGSVTVIFYDDRVEITNFGTLPSELKVADLKRVHASIPNNPDIAQVCYLHGTIEKVGRGTLNILDECDKYGFRRPEWVCEMGTTKVIFHQAFTSEPKLTKRQIQILKFLQENQKFSSQEYIEIIKKLSDKKIAERTARSDLSILVEGGWLEMLGKTKNTFYIKTNKIIAE